MSKMRIRKGDLVKVISGKDKGKEGKILRNFPKEGKVIVEGVNMVTRHVKPTPKSPQSGLVKKEAPLHAAKIMLVCPSCGKATRVSRAFLEDGRKVRVFKKCGEIVDRV